MPTVSILRLWESSELDEIFIKNHKVSQFPFVDPVAPKFWQFVMMSRHCHWNPTA
jgi:hypothetical protein